jgi:hypothetical protein
LFVAGQFDDYVNANRIISKRDAGGSNYAWFLAGATSWGYYDGSGTKTYSPVNWAGSSTMAVTQAHDAKGLGYVDGSFSDEANLTASVLPNDAPLLIGNYYAADRPLVNPLSMVAIFPAVLTPPEISDLHDWSQSRITPRKQWPGGGLRYPDRETNLLTDGAAAWTPLNNAIITDQADDWIRVAYNGTVNPEGRQIVVTQGQQYRLTGEARGDGVGGLPYFIEQSTAIFAGVASQATQPIDVVFTATGAWSRIRNQSAGGYAEFRNLKLWTRPPGYTPRTGDPLYLDNIQSARVTLADETSGKLSNTPYTIESGTWKLAEDATTGERYIECVLSGIISRRNLEAYGTWDLDILKADASTQRLFLVQSQRSISAGAGYNWFLSSAERLRFQSIAAGILFQTADDYLTAGVKHSLRMTRSAAGVWNAYIKGGAFAEWTFVDTVTDNSTTTGLYCVFDMDAGDRLYLDRQFAGVVTP